MNDKTDDELREMCGQVLRDDNAPYGGPDETDLRFQAAASAAPTLARALLQRIDAPGPRLTEAEAFERAKNWLHTQFGSHTPRDIWEKLRPDDIRELATEFRRLSAQPKETGKVKSHLLTGVREKLGDLYTKTKLDWELVVHVTLTEPTCPTVIIRPEGGKSSRYRFDCDTIEEGIAKAVSAVHREVLLGKKVEPECPWTDVGDVEEIAPEKAEGETP